MKARIFLLALHLIGIVLATGCGMKSPEPEVSSSPRTRKASSTSDERLQWNIETLVGAYLKTGQRNDQWDEPATNLLTRFARIRASTEDMDETQWILLRADAREAVGKGCNDPLVLYLYSRYAAPEIASATDESTSASFKRAAEVMKDKPYPPIRHFYIYLRAAQNLWATRKGNESWPEVSLYRQMAGGYLTGALKDPAIPKGEASEACQEFVTAVDDHPSQFKRLWDPIEAELLQRWPDEAFVYLLQGTARIAAAWGARGGGYSDKVTTEGRKGFAANLALASESLEKAWKLDPTNPEIARQMMRVELGEGKGRKRLELWFDRAMKLDTNYYAACEAKLLYLDPKWYGSPDALLEFGRECVASDTWGGNIPLILMDAHRSLNRYASESGVTNYWHQPEVWRDIKSAFDKFFLLNPTAVGWHHNYAWYAYEAGEWEEFNKRLPLLSPVNYSFFGGQTNFEKMVKIARERGTRQPDK